MWMDDTCVVAVINPVLWIRSSVPGRKAKKALPRFL